MFQWLCFIDPSGANGITGMIWAIVACMVAAVVGFVLEFTTYKPEEA
jgi:PTS system beta-glucosides-specific IIC component